jgi:hypothetical protein
MFRWTEMMLQSDLSSLRKARALPRRDQPKPVRGVFERPKGSGVWWVSYYENGRQHREKAGSRATAIDLYRERKAAI